MNRSAIRATALGERNSQLRKAKAIVAYAEALQSNLPADLHTAHALAKALDPGGADPELSEIAQLLERHPAF